MNLIMFQLVRNILATQPRVTRFKIEWDDKPGSALTNGAGPSSELAQHDNDNSIDQGNDSNSAPPLIGSSANNGDSFGRDRLSADSTSSLMEPPPTNFLGANNNDSLSSPMEVI